MCGNCALGEKRYVDFRGVVVLNDSELSQFLGDDNTIVNQLLDGANK